LSSLCLLFDARPPDWFGEQGHTSDLLTEWRILGIKLGVLAHATPDTGGAYQYTLSMLQALQHTTGFEVTVYGNPKNPDFADLDFPICPFSESRARQVMALTAHRMHARLPDPFLAQDILLAPFHSLALLHTSKPFAYTLHDLQQNHYPEHFGWWTRAWRHQIHSQLVRRARLVVCESRYVRTDIMRFFDIPEERTALIAAPPMRHFSADESDDLVQAARVRLKLPERFLLYPAQFWPHKNHFRLIEAFRDVVAEVPDLKLVLTGKKRFGYDAVMAAINKFGLNDNVCLLGYVEREDLRAIYKLATALVMPSLFESVSIPIYEAFQVGTPVAASGILAIPDQVGDAGLLFDPKSVPSIKEAILKIVQDPETARLLGKRGRERMLAITPAQYGAQLQNLLRELL
jgi:glycosyltransferase involved in cell wall biosynthesis